MKSFKHTSGLFRAASVLALAGALTACVSPTAGKNGLYAKPIGDAPVTANPTAYSQALICVGQYARGKNIVGPRVAVGRILDYTGKVDVEGGRRITQGASLMAITAFAKAGARLVERFDTSVSELELRYANNRLIADGASEPRPIIAGQVPGSDFYLVGGITELNYNIRSSGIDAAIGDRDPTDPKVNFGGKLFVMNIGLDLRLVSTQTLEVVDVVSYQKQIIGREVRAGVFAFGNDNVFDVGGGERALEPIQMAVRAGVERAVVEMMSNLYGIQDPSVCGAALAAGGDPMGSANASGNFRNVNGVSAAAASARRVDEDAWHQNRDDAMRAVMKPTATTSSTPSANAAPTATTAPALHSRPNNTIAPTPAPNAQPKRTPSRPSNSPSVTSRTQQPPQATQTAQNTARITNTARRVAPPAQPAPSLRGTTR